VYDTVLSISWLQDANLVKTLCDASDPLWTNWPEPNPAVTNNSGRTKAQICSDSGQMNWYEAEAWVAYLNTNNYLETNTWRQPNTGPVNGVAINDTNACDGSTDFGFNISGPDGTFPGSMGSEMAYMHYNNLGNGSLFSPTCVNQQASVCPGPNRCLQNRDVFSNMTLNWYGSGTDRLTTTAWVFIFYSGGQEYDDKDSGEAAEYGNVWPVHSGEPSGAPEPTTSVPMLSLWGLGLMGLLLAALARRRLR
jgi:MYXO-CTERM domain-containing protein